MNVQKSAGDSAAGGAKGQNASRQPPLHRKDSSQVASQKDNTHYDPSQRGNSKRRPAPVTKQQPNQSRKISATEETISGLNNKFSANEAVIIKNTELEQIKSNLNAFKQEQQNKQSQIGALDNNKGLVQNNSVGGPSESIFGLMGSTNEQYDGLAVNKQNSQTMQRSPKVYTSDQVPGLGGDNFSQGVLNAQQQSQQQPSMIGLGNNEIIPRGRGIANIHSHAIVGSGMVHAQSSAMNENIDKELKRKLYQDELQRQIRERDEYRKREQDGYSTKYAGGRGNSVTRQQEPNSESITGLAGQTNQTGFFPWQQRSSLEKNSFPTSSVNDGMVGQSSNQFMQSDKNLSQKLQEINGSQQQSSTFYQGQSKVPASMHYNAMQTKMDFPSIMTRGKVTEGRIDIELESRGTIFQGRDEKSILVKKKEDTQQAMRDALQRQIEEKNRKKEEEKQREKILQMQDEQRIRAELNQSQEPQSNSFAGGRKTMYSNHHQVSIIGSGVPQNQQDFKLPDIEGAGIRSPNSKIMNGREMDLIKEEPAAESLYDMVGQKQANTFDHGVSAQNQITNDMLLREAEQLDQKNKQINELSDMVKLLLQEQQSLKEKLNEQENKMRDLNQAPGSKDANILQRKQTAITKKASERTRSQNPPKKTIQSADNKSVQARKLKEQHAIEQAKLEAIESKILKARQRIEETKQQKSITAQQTRIKLQGGPSQNDDINELLYGNSEDQSLKAQQEALLSQQHVPIIGGRHKSNPGVGIVGGLPNATGHGSLHTAPNNNKTVYTPNSMMLQHQKSALPPTANNASNRNFGADKAQKAPRGQSNKISQSQLPLSSIEQDYEEENIVALNQKKTSIGTNSNNIASKQNINQNQSSSFPNNSKSRTVQNTSQISGVNNQMSESINQSENFNLDSEGVSQLQYPAQEGQFYSPNVMQSYTKKQITPSQQEDIYRPQIENTTQQNYYMPYDPAKYGASIQSQQNQIRPKQNMSDFNYNYQYDLQGSKEFISKNPSTAAGTYFHGGFGGQNHQVSQGGIGQMENQSFDLDIMMPPDVASIDSDLNKLSALTPQPNFKNDYNMNGMGGGGFDNMNNYAGATAIRFDMNPQENFLVGAGNTHYSMRQPIKNFNMSSNNYGQNNNNANYGAISHFDDDQSAFDSKYSPSRGGGPNATSYSKDIYSGNNGYYE